jgi:hypothetical protein
MLVYRHPSSSKEAGPRKRHRQRRLLRTRRRVSIYLLLDQRLIQGSVSWCDTLPRFVRRMLGGLEQVSTSTAALSLVKGAQMCCTAMNKKEPRPAVNSDMNSTNGKTPLTCKKGHNCSPTLPKSHARGKYQYLQSCIACINPYHNAVSLPLN